GHRVRRHPTGEDQPSVGAALRRRPWRSGTTALRRGPADSGVDPGDAAPDAAAYGRRAPRRRAGPGGSAPRPDAPTGSGHQARPGGAVADRRGRVVLRDVGRRIATPAGRAVLDPSLVASA